MAVQHREGRGLKVHLDGDEIVVRQRGTVFLIAFKKAPRQPRLIVTRNWLPNFASKPLAEFRARAAQLAVNKARALGWGVVAALAGKRIRPSPVARDHPRRSPGDRRSVGGLKLHCCSEPLSRASNSVHDSLTT
jgi:hypothetical protein